VNFAWGEAAMAASVRLRAGRLEWSWRPGMLTVFRRLMKHTQGATAVEYTLITSLIAVAAIASMRSVSGKVSNVLGNTASVLN